MKKILFFIIFILVLTPSIVKAECSTEELDKYKSFASNIKHNLVLEKDNSYTINFLNIPDTLIVGDVPGNIYTKNEDKRSGLVSEYKYNVLILTNDKTNCPYTTIENRWIDIPKIKKETKKEVSNNNLYFILGGIGLIGIIVFILFIILGKRKKSVL